MSQIQSIQLIPADNVNTMLSEIAAKYRDVRKTLKEYVVKMAEKYEKPTRLLVEILALLQRANVDVNVKIRILAVFVSQELKVSMNYYDIVRIRVDSSASWYKLFFKTDDERIVEREFITPESLRNCEEYGYPMSMCESDTLSFILTVYNTVTFPEIMRYISTGMGKIVEAKEVILSLLESRRTVNIELVEFARVAALKNF